MHSYILIEGYKELCVEKLQSSLCCLAQSKPVCKPLYDPGFTIDL